MWAYPGLFFVYFRPYHITNQLQIEKSVDGVLEIRTQGRRMVGTDETTELWRPPLLSNVMANLDAPMLLSNVRTHVSHSSHPSNVPNKGYSLEWETSD